MITTFWDKTYQLNGIKSNKYLVSSRVELKLLSLDPDTTNKSERKISFEVIDAILKDMRKAFVDRVNKEFE